MLYLSELTNKAYKTVEELEKAEAEKKAEIAALEEKRREQERREKEVIDAFKEVEELQNKADELLVAYYEEYRDCPVELKRVFKSPFSLIELMFD